MRKYSKCEWCGRTIDITNHDIGLCKPCSTYHSYGEMIKLHRLYLKILNRLYPGINEDTTKTMSKYVLKEFINVHS